MLKSMQSLRPLVKINIRSYKKLNVPKSTAELLTRYIKPELILNTEKYNVNSKDDKNNLNKISLSLKDLKGFQSSGLKRTDIINYMDKFVESKQVKEVLISFGISEKDIDDILAKFQKKVLNEDYGKLKFDSLATILDEEGTFALDKYLLTYLCQKVLVDKGYKKFNYLKSLSSCIHPETWYPKARRMKRNIIMHVGPTNSGKTYQALEKLKKSSKGIYCGPLRLLAFEVYSKLNSLNIPCTLITGEERIVNENAKLTSSTVEMVTVNQSYDVAVIDEIQMLNDPNRGWSWLRAVIGLQANEIHLCGEPSAVNIIKKLGELCGDNVIVNRYERLSQLDIPNLSLRMDYKNIQKGDCLVSFNRNHIFKHKELIEKKTGLKCAVVYGKLPPENRAMQAQLFNDPDSGYDVMVASDAVGMGLNLNIRRVIFDTLEKFNGKDQIKVPIHQIKQIAGRAGRFKTLNDRGVALAFKPNDSRYLKEAMSQVNPNVNEISLQPEFSQLQLFAHQFPNDTFSQILFKFSLLSNVEEPYFLSLSHEHLKIAQLFDNLPLSLQDRHVLVLAPIPKDEAIKSFAHSIIERHGNNQLVLLKDVLKPTSEINNLADLEKAHKCVMLYLWLSYKFPITFVDLDTCQEVKLQLEEKIDALLRNEKLKN